MKLNGKAYIYIKLGLTVTQQNFSTRAKQCGVMR